MTFRVSVIALVIFLVSTPSRAEDLAKLIACMEAFDARLERSMPSQGSWEHSCSVADNGVHKCEAHLPPKPRNQREWFTANAEAVAAMRATAACWQRLALVKAEATEHALGFDWTVYRSASASLECRLIEEPDLTLATRFGLHVMMLCGKPD